MKYSEIEIMGAGQLAYKKYVDNHEASIFRTVPPSRWDREQYMVMGMAYLMEQDSLVEKLQTENQSIKQSLVIAIMALKEINRQELNAQRPGGGHSRSATISYEALKTLKQPIAD